MSALSRVLLLLACAALPACASLLPSGSSEVRSAFPSFEAARAAIERVVPYRTTVAELGQLGFDLQDSANVTRIPYPELISRLAPNPAVPLDEMDAGIRDCILSRQECRAYQFQLGEQRRRREGNFMLDFLNFKRTTHVTGWRFEGLIVVRNGVVLFRNYGGEPQADRREQQVNPLGPLQPAGEGAGSAVLRGRF